VAKDKSKKKNKTKAPSVDTLKAREAEIEAKLESKAANPHLVHLARVAELDAIVQDKSNPKAERKAARAELEGLRAATVERQAAEPVEPEEVQESAARGASLPPLTGSETDDELKERVKAKNAARAARDALDPDKVDRADAEAVADYNEVEGRASGAYLTSDAERAENDAKLAAGPKPRKAKATELVVEIDGKHLAAPEVVEVATETGREFAVAPEAAEVVDEFAGVTPQVELNGRGQYKIMNIATGKMTGRTRVTTYIDNLEFKGALTDWKLRTLLEGVVVNEESVGMAEKGDKRERLLSTVADAVHVRDSKLKKLAKRDRKGELDKGERGVATYAINREYKATLDNAVTEALDLGGVHEKANKGTDLHALCEVVDDPKRGWPAVKTMLDSGLITPADVDDVRAYANAMAAAGIKVLEVEQFVTNDELNTAGRLDRIVLAKPAHGAARAVRMVADIKTESITASGRSPNS
jgi:hypothetical protein